MKSLNENVFKIAYEDDYLLVVEKPFGLVVNNSITTKNKTLQNYIVDYLGEEAFAGYESDFGLRNGIVHRLDKDTSGLLIIAKTEETFFSLQKQFKERDITKEYLSVVCGTLKDNLLKINAPLKRHPKDKFKYAVVAEGKDALTEVIKLSELEKNNKKYTFIKVLPLTGRTHQIRVHMAAINHPIAGDPIYCTEKQFQDSINDFHRLMLHAYKLSFIHPHSLSAIELTSDLPDNFPSLS